MQKTDQDDRLLTRSEVHTQFGLTQRYLEVAAVRGDGPPMIKIGRSVRYRTGDLREWIKSHQVNSTSEVAQ
jgi:predicted DNA-binding transcriptional regulator AlpA